MRTTNLRECFRGERYKDLIQGVREAELKCYREEGARLNTEGVVQTNAWRVRVYKEGGLIEGGA